MSKEITIKDVAKQAGVSISTVSRVLNGLDRVSVDTRSKVLKVAKALNYTPNNIAISMVKKSSRMIVVVVPDIKNPFYTAVIRGVEEIAKDSGYHMFVYATDEKVEEENELYNGVLGKIVDGVIAIPLSHDVQIYKNYYRPIVLVDRDLNDSELDEVVVDNFGGSYQITEHLIEKGHKDIAIILGSMDFNIGIERFNGFKKALSDNGISVNNDYVFEGSWEKENGYESTIKLLAADKKPTAIYATNNMICMGVIKALYDNKIKIGDEISLVGFDDNTLARFVNPTVTVIDRPTVEMGRVAARKLIEKIKNKNSVPIKSTLGVRIISRNSVKTLNE